MPSGKLDTEMLRPI